MHAQREVGVALLQLLELSVGAHRPRACERLRELGHDDRDDHRRGHRTADALHEAGGHQHHLVLGKTAHGGGEREDGHTGQENALAADQVTQTAGQ